ncbi:hypothetical protein PQX77_017565 [Marasmius sp. AFHP31]|nr:hypothetical protein PQX77_017565 [Marasmius sp. AFHP31]
MVQHTPEQVLQSAKFHLAGLRWHTLSDNEVPQSYIDTLTSFLKDYPDDTNFRIVAQAEKGYGTIRCNEEGCRSDPLIQLEHNSRLQDGGLKDGVGSLSKYRTHIIRHPSHTDARNKRVQNESTRQGNSNNTPSVLIKRERSVRNLSGTKPSTSSAHPLPFSNTPSKVAPARTPSTSTASARPLTPLEIARRRIRASEGGISIKPEPSEATVPLKRRASESIDQGTPVGSSASSQRKPSAASFPSTQNSKALIPKTSGSSQAGQPDIADVKEKIRNIQSSISRKTELMNALLRKRKMQSDYTRINRYQQEIEALNREKDELTRSIPTAPFSPQRRPMIHSWTPQVSVKSEPIVKTEYDLLQPDLYGNTMPVAGPSTVATRPIVLPPPPFLKQDPYLSEEEPDVRFTGDAAAMNVAQRFMNDIPQVAPMHDSYDENGDFYGRGRDLFEGPQAKADDIEKFLVEAGNAEQFDGSATVDEALKKLGLPSVYVPLLNMEVALMPHQTIGVAWMIEKESGKIMGGCLADEMGLGKTVQMIALMTKNRSTNPSCKTNLIVAPLALLDQWKMEIELKTSDAFKCLVYHGNNKPRRKSDLLSYDVVITTPNTMSLEWPDEEGEKRRKKSAAKKKVDNFIVNDSDSDDEPAAKRRKKERGLLFQVDFYRIILDEAQVIRSRKTRASRAITDLSAKYRWCLTGTPIVNSLADTYGYIRFLRIRPFYDWNEFNEQVARPEKKNPALAVLRLQKIFDTFLLRRKKDTMLDGKRLIELPPRNVHLNKLEFSEEEKEVYEMVERKSQAIFNRYMRAGTVLKNYSQVLVLLLRLRQICSHPCLIQEQGGAFVMPDEVESETRPEVRRELARARDLVSPAFVVKMKERFKDEALKRIQAEKESAEATVDEECPICYDAFTDPIITPCGHVFCWECTLNVLNNSHVELPDNPIRYQPDERPCPACRSPINVNRLFMRAAFEPTDEDLFPLEKPEKLDGTGPEMMEVDEVVRPKKRSSKGKAKARALPPAGDLSGVIDIDALVFDSEDNAASELRQSNRPGKLPVYIISDSEDGDQEEDAGSDDSLDDFIVQSDEDEEEKDARHEQRKSLGRRKAQIVLDSDDEIDDTAEEEEVIFGGKKKKTKTPEEIKLLPRFLPSTKMKWMMEEVQRLFREKPDEKILIISQWTGCLTLVSDYLSEYNVRHVKYQGDMTRVKREQAVRVFMSKDNAPIMLMSMKCGGVGLNLTRGNNVIALDLGWSQAIENQAFDRVHRLGQARDVNIHRLVIGNTVEDRIMALQERKQNLADGSLGEGNGKKIGKMTVKELAGLFGVDERGRVVTAR